MRGAHVKASQETQYLLCHDDEICGKTTKNSPNILLTYGSMSTSWRCWCVCAWYRRRVESSRMDTHTPSPIHASCRTWLSLRGWASKDFYGTTWRESALPFDAQWKINKWSRLGTHLDLHVFGLNDVNLVLVAAPHLIVDDSHAADGVMRPTEVHEVVVGQIPLTICGSQNNAN